MNNNPLHDFEIPDPNLSEIPSNSIPQGMSVEDFVNQQIASALSAEDEQQYNQVLTQGHNIQTTQATSSPPAPATTPATKPVPASAPATTPATKPVPASAPAKNSTAKGKKTMKNPSNNYIPNRINMPKNIADAQNNIKKMSEKEFIENLLGYQTKTNKSNYWAARFYNENHPDSKQSIDAAEWDLFKKDSNYNARANDKIDKDFSDFANHKVISHYQNVALEAAYKSVEKIDPQGLIFKEIVDQVNANKKTVSGNASEQVLFIAQTVINDKVNDKSVASQASHALVTNYASLSRSTNQNGIDVPSNFANSVQNEKSLLDQLDLKIDDKDIKEKLEVAYGTLSSVEKLAVRNGLGALQAAKGDLNGNDIANNVKDVLLTINPKKGSDLTNELKSVMNLEPPKDITAKADTQPDKQGGNKNSNKNTNYKNKGNKKDGDEDKDDEEELDNKQKNQNQNFNNKGVPMGSTATAAMDAETFLQRQLVGAGVGIGRFIKEVSSGIGGGVGGFLGNGARSFIDGINDKRDAKAKAKAQEQSQAQAQPQVQNQTPSASIWDNIINDQPTSNLLNDTDKKIIKNIHTNFEKIKQLSDEMETVPTAENKNKLGYALINHMNFCQDFMTENINEKGEKTEFISTLAKDIDDLNDEILPIVSRYFSADDPNNPNTVTNSFDKIDGLINAFASNMTKLFDNFKNAMSNVTSNTNTSQASNAYPQLPAPPTPRP